VRAFLRIPSLGVDPLAGKRFERIELQPLALDRVLHARLAEIIEDHRGKAVGADDLHLPAVAADLGALDLLLDADRAMRAERFHGKRAADADRFLVLVGLVVERLALGVPCDGRVDLLTRHAFLDFRIIGNGLQRDVRHPLVDEALADVGLFGVRRLAFAFQKTLRTGQR